ncbi:TPA: hypothetical protein ACH3X2_011986 [Trebouxia sp. C0005]
MMHSQPAVKQNTDKSDWVIAILEVLDLSLLSSQSIGALLATSRQLYEYVHDNSTSLKLQNSRELVLLVRQNWPRLANLALHPTGWPKAAAVAQGSPHALQKHDFSSCLELLDMQHLAGSMLPHLSNLKLGFCGVGPGMCNALVNGHWPHLAVLDLRGNLLGPADVQDLGQGHLPSLASLNLGNNTVGMQSPTICWELCKWPHLTELKVSKCYLGVPDIQGLVRGHWPLLACLDVSHNSLEHIYLTSLAQGHWPELLQLRLASNDNSAAEELHQANWKALRMLDLGASHCTPLEAVHAVLRVFRGSLHTLKVCCEMHTVTAASAKQQSWPCKTSLCLNAIATAEVLQSLAHGHWPIRWFSLHCLYSDAGIITKLFEISLPRMESLSLYGQHLGLYIDTPSFSLQDGNWPALQHLHLNNCGLEDNFMVRLASGQWPLLKILDLSANYLTSQGAIQLVAGHWPNLSVLDLRFNEFDITFKLCESVLKEHESFVKSIKVKWPVVELLVTDEDTELSSHACRP